MARQIGQHPLRPKAKETLTADGGLGTGKLSATADPGTNALESECRLKLPVNVWVVEVCRKYWCTSRALALKIPRYADKPPPSQKLLSIIVVSCAFRSSSSLPAPRCH
jgi:hypothetical protein